MTPPLPNFIIAGVLGAGTGQLYALLLQHPDVYLPLPMAPECNFFYKTAEYEKGIDYYVRRYFSAWSGQHAIGERSSLLLSGEWVPERLHRALPDVRLVVLVRDPVERAYAHYRFTAFAGFEELTFEQALRAEDARADAEPDLGWRELRRYAYFRRGLYEQQLRAFLRFFPRERVLVLRSDALVAGRDDTMRRVFAFLRVDPWATLADRGDFSTPSVLSLARQTELRRASPREFDAALQRFREGLPAETECDRLLRENVAPTKEPMSERVRQQLRERYREPNERFAALVGLSIDDWLA
ncbi:MAG: sulfotransferase [Myxococcota bacterium]